MASPTTTTKPASVNGSAGLDAIAAFLQSSDLPVETKRAIAKAAVHSAPRVQHLAPGAKSTDGDWTNNTKSHMVYVCIPGSKGLMRRPAFFGALLDNPEQLRAAVDAANAADAADDNGK